MSPLRRRLIEGMQIRNLAPSTQRAYVAQFVHFACYFLLISVAASHVCTASTGPARMPRLGSRRLSRGAGCRGSPGTCYGRYPKNLDRPAVDLREARLYMWTYTP